MRYIEIDIVSLVFGIIPHLLEGFLQHQRKHLSVASKSKWQVAGAVKICSFVSPVTPTGCSELWDAITELAAGAKVRLYKPADEPSKSRGGAAARLLKVVSY